MNKEFTQTLLRAQPAGSRYSSTEKQSEIEAANNFVSEYQLLSIPTSKAPEFIDLTEAVQNLVQQSGIEFGTANIQTRHTTTGLLINENEPLLLEDFARQLDVMASPQVHYRHDELELRTGIPAYERQNGHAHCKAMTLRSSETVNIARNKLDLGQWQSIFLVELDIACSRTVSVMLMGLRMRGKGEPKQNGLDHRKADRRCF